VTSEPARLTLADWKSRAAVIEPQTGAFIDGRFVPAASGRTFRDIVGRSPRTYRKEATATGVPTCFTMAWMQPGA